MPTPKVQELAPQDLRRAFDPRDVPFETSDQAQECREAVLGQDRAKEALEFGLRVKGMDYHIFVAGPRQTGKTHLVRSFVEKVAAGQPAPDDWVYVHNFREPEQPKALRLPPGQGRVLARQMDELVAKLKEKIPALFEGDDYNRQKEQLTADFKRKRTEVFSVLDKAAREKGYVLRFEPTGIMVVPADEDGEPLPEQAIREMTEDQRAELRERADAIQSSVQESLRQVNAMEKELNESLKNLDTELVLGAVGRHLDELFEAYAGQADVEAHLRQLKDDLVENYERFTKSDKPQAPFPVPQGEDSFQEYKVNVFVDNSEAQGAPVVVETNPTFPNLFGRIERQAQFGALLTDFTLLRPGALHKANGGYLVLPMRELLWYFLPWQGLKRSLLDGRLAMEDAMEQWGYMVTRTLKPQPIPLELKVILVGDNMLHHLLHAYDPQFSKLFKVKAEMAERMEWGQEEAGHLISHVCQVQRQRDLLPLHRGAMARLVELAAELAGDRERLTLRLAQVEDVAVEADFFARQAGHARVEAGDVDTALTKRRRRASMLEERMREGVTRGFVNVMTTGEAVGQVNGLAVLDLGDHAFGKPSRISATVGLGREGVAAIDRESELSGPFHTKGVLILAGFLRGRFAAKLPLALTASLVFEQSYSMIDGDSASVAETLALMSALAELPMRQDLAVTGSISQQGQVQAIGGVNQKIEGFFRVCQEAGLTGDQGVAIPAANVKNLMVHPDVAEAVAQGKFHIYPLETLDQAMELFMGKPAGQRNKQGNYPRGSINYRVEKRLKDMAEAARKMADDKKK